MPPLLPVSWLAGTASPACDCLLGRRICRRTGPAWSEGWSPAEMICVQAEVQEVSSRPKKEIAGRLWWVTVACPASDSLACRPSAEGRR